MKCKECKGRGEIAAEVGLSGYGDPETKVEIDTCLACKGTGEELCSVCGDERALADRQCIVCLAADAVDRAPGLCELAIMLARLQARRSPVPSRASRIGSIAVAVSCGRAVVGKRYSVGAWLPAVPDGYAYAVFNINGPVFLAHDAFEVARAYDDALTGAWDPSPEAPPVRRMSDAEQSSVAFLDRMDDPIMKYRMDLFDRQRAARASQAGNENHE